MTNTKALLFDIDCGSTTCVSVPGTFCQYLGTKRLGTANVCLLFPDLDKPRGDVASTDLTDKDGWIQRCPACLDAERNARIVTTAAQLLAHTPEKPVDLSDGWELLAEYGEWQHWHAIGVPNEHVTHNTRIGGQLHCFGFWGFVNFHDLAYGKRQYACPEGCAHGRRNDERR